MYEVRYINYLYAMGMSSDDPILQRLGALPTPMVSQYSI